MSQAAEPPEPLLYRLAKHYSVLRPSVQQAVAELRMNRPQQALLVLEAVEHADPVPCPRCNYPLGLIAHLDQRQPEPTWCAS